MKNRNKMNNNGFSLIELIIVIAIMAVLIGVLAPQYMKYVERGRATADRDNIAAIKNALEVYYVDPNAASSFAGGETVTLLRTGAAAQPDGPAKDALVNAGLPTDAKALTLSNKTTFQKCVITVSITGTGDSAKITVEAVETP